MPGPAPTTSKNAADVAPVAAGLPTEILGASGNQLGRFPAARLAESGPLHRGLAARSATVALVFDDGYRSNYLHALPVLKRYGFAATMAVEVEKVGEDYDGNPALPVCTVADLRELVDAGWEVCNHPSLDLGLTEAAMVAAARAENALLRDLLSGAKRKDYTTGAVTNGAVERADLAALAVETAVYRGGLRSATSDRAYRYLFDKYRTIQGPTATRGDALYAWAEGGEAASMPSAFALDTTSNSVARSVAFVEALAMSGASGVLYAHDTPVGAGGPNPWLSAADLDAILRRCAELGVAVVPLRNLYRANVAGDPRFDGQQWVLGARAGDTCDYYAADTLNGGARSVRMVSVAGVNNLNTGARSLPFAVRPWSKYLLRVRYKIDADLVLVGGAANRNHGLSFALETLVGNTPEETYGTDNVALRCLNTATQALPYQATGGAWAEFSFVVVTLGGAYAQLRFGLSQATGTALVGHVSMERIASLRDSPLRGSALTFNAYNGRTLYLPSLSTTNKRRAVWDVRTKAASTAQTVQVSWAYESDADRASFASGDTVYVLGRGAGAFALRGGQIATWNGSSWSFSQPAAGAVIRVVNWLGVGNQFVRVIGPGVVTGGTAAVYEPLGSSRWFDDGHVEGDGTGGSVTVWNRSGRSDAFTWTARPVALTDGFD